ncbi:hypothetical protein SYNPS1DRAFT_27378 [Syncephalis pseudoplumigaleata]|uniref:intramembrane prenyl-peptidase Rce1 n=1 Tax=Syncephalis pseudoplumigaleata TaxID=1712513 RepID=A0A4P9Z529_9FUNG|nr:hypothetical protein SYNPS1DRAFT_27625 [Syncephalis pseudoplumigaleata]RKP26946.1 hypothetical protein SYNPS1DRAFT_27378 [Syncephalis pseudoplumigaleata]|eukprot:RKP26700.1 hypothetical protein SYNPS1DRAFT_27625 [Syncephalis pseudoplumigaleata]
MSALIMESVSAPAVATSEALWGGVGIGSMFVGGLYVLGNRRLVACHWNRDHPQVIMDRIRAVFITCVVVACLLSWLFLQRGVVTRVATRLLQSSTTHQPASELDALLAIFGLHWLAPARRMLMATTWPLLHTMLLFLGPLVVRWQDYRERMANYDADEHPSYGHTHRWRIRLRNYVVGPLSEEFVFRACLGALFAQTALSTTSIVFLSSWLFGLAHVHHAWEMYAKTRTQKNALRIALARTGFQLAYCTVFGSYVMLLFLRTGHLIGPILSHAFCNIMGLPDCSRLRTADGRWDIGMLTVHLLGVLLFIMTASTLLDASLYHSIYWH